MVISVKNKRGQFFILSAVIIASIIIGMTSVKNYVTVGDAPRNFYYYSEQLSDESSAVVDYALYNGEVGKLEGFIGESSEKILESSQGAHLVICYTKSNGNLTCQNNGTKYITLNMSGSVVNLSGEKEVVSCGVNECPSIHDFIINDNSILVVKINGSDTNYNVEIPSYFVQKSQFYFIFSVSTPSGEFTDTSDDS